MTDVVMLRNADKEKYRSIFGKIEVMDNVAIGTGSIILPNIVLGLNVIVVAGSVVTKFFIGGEAGIVIGENPAKIN